MWQRPQNFLGVTKSEGGVNFDVSEIEPDKTGAPTGIRWRSLGPGLVPIFEEHLVRTERKYTLQEWYALDPMERAIAIAVFRIDRAIKAHQASAEAVKMEKEAKKAASKGKK